jgi:FkbM family methyltransferase
MSERALLHLGGVDVLVRPGTSDEVVARDNLVKHSYFRHGVQPVAAWLDLGAYIGTFMLSVLEAGGSVVGYEPFPESAQLAHANLALNGYTESPATGARAQLVQRAVLWGVGGMHSLAVNEHRGNYAANTLIPHWKRKRTAMHVEVEPFTEALLYAQGVLRASRLSLKMDTEGAELAVLDNWDAAWPVLQLAFEYHFAKDPDLDACRARLHRLEEAGYTVHTSRKVPAGQQWQAHRMNTMQVWAVRA